ncbi:MAG TPA: hypothetical protein VIL42_10720 [Sphingomicrobium sp.]|jgi:hypothetical protein
MADYAWPEDLVPYAVEFWLQPHTGGSESPFTRQGKYYGLSAPRWVCSMSFRGADSYRNWGTGPHVTGPQMDAFLAKMQGRLNRVSIFDFRRREPTDPDWSLSASNLAAAAGSSSITITGLTPGTVVYAGDYIGGDGRPHIFTSSDLGRVAGTADGTGQATVSFMPPLAADLDAGAATFADATGMFRLVSDDAGQNGSEVGQLTTYSLTFLEDMSPDYSVTFNDDTVTYSL